MAALRRRNATLGRQKMTYQNKTSGAVIYWIRNFWPSLVMARMIGHCRSLRYHTNGYLDAKDLLLLILRREKHQAFCMVAIGKA